MILLLSLVGIASWYDPGVMDRVIVNQQKWGHIGAHEHYDGFVAVPECELIGDVLFMRPVRLDPGPDIPRFESFLIVDCPGSKEVYNWMVNGNILVEVDWETKVRWGLEHGSKEVEVVYPLDNLDKVW